MSVLFYLLCLGVLLILIDILFFRNCILVSVGLIVLFVDLQLAIDIPWVLRVFISLFFAFGVWMLYSRWWPYILNKLPVKDLYNAGVTGLVGKTGKVRIIDGKTLAQIDGDLYPFYKDYPLSEGECFKVTQIIDGRIVIKR